MKPSEILYYLKTTLPLFTQRFTETITGVTGTVTTSTPTALTLTVTVPGTVNPYNVGDIYQSFGVEFTNPITLATQLTPQEVEFTTQYDHDLTLGWQAQVKVQPQALQPLGGVEVELVAVPNRRTFSVTVPPNTTATAWVASMVQPRLIERNRLDVSQYFRVIAKAGQQLTLQGPAVAALGVGQTLAGGAIRGNRIYGAATLEQFVAFYEQGEYKRLQALQPAANADSQYTLCVIMQPSRASKDRKTLSDAVASQGDSYDTQTLVEGFNVAVFAPTLSSNLGERQAEAMYEEMRNALFSALLGRKFSTGMPQGAGASLSSVSFVEHGPFMSNGAYYIHLYSFQTTVELNFGNTVLPHIDRLGGTVAFRDVELALLNPDQEVVMQSDIDLDRRPL